MSQFDDSGRATSRVGELLDENERLRLEFARLKGELEMLRERIGAQDAADEHRRAELDATRAEAAAARAEVREAQVRVEEWRRMVADTQSRLGVAERERIRAEQERSAVIAALGRRARKQLRRGSAPDLPAERSPAGTARSGDRPGGRARESDAQ